jgi:hypothetical protein
MMVRVRVLTRKNHPDPGEPPRLARPHTIPTRKDPRMRLGFLPNGSALNGGASQVLKPQQHGEHPFELAVEMHLAVSASTVR